MEYDYPDWKTYETLYHKYVYGGRDPAELFDIALQTHGTPQGGFRRPGNCLAGKKVMDLCAGTGRLTRSALDSEAEKVLVIEKQFEMLKYDSFLCQNQKDFEIAMMLNNHYDDTRVKFLLGDVDMKLQDDVCVNFKADFAFCQQAVNNWLNSYTAKWLQKAMAPRGVFVFSTFNNKPPIKPRYLSYWEAGKQYVEVVQVIKGIFGESFYPEERVEREWVYHVQTCEGLEPHVTRFPWIPPEEYDRMLSPYFSVQRIREGKTDIYRCVSLIS